MSLKRTIQTDKKLPNSILSFSNQSITAYRLFSKENFLDMMSEMSFEEIKLDLERFKNLEEYEICKSIEFVIDEKRKSEMVNTTILTDAVNI